MQFSTASPTDEKKRKKKRKKKKNNLLKKDVLKPAHAQHKTKRDVQRSVEAAASERTLTVSRVRSQSVLNPRLRRILPIFRRIKV